MFQKQIVPISDDFVIIANPSDLQSPLDLPSFDVTGMTFECTSNEEGTFADRDQFVHIEGNFLPSSYVYHCEDGEDGEEYVVVE